MRRPTAGVEEAWSQWIGGLMRRIGIAVALLALLVGGCAEQETRLARESMGLVSSADRVAQLKAQLAARPNDARLLRAIGVEYARQARWTESAGAYREALLVAPSDRAAVLGYGRALVGGRNFAAARDAGLAALAGRRDREALMLAGVALAAERRTQDARTLLAEALALAPRDLAARTNLALALALAGDASAYGQMHMVAFAPDADLRHRRNLVLIGGILGLEDRARADGATLGIGAEEASAILAIGRRARTEGASAFGVAAVI